MAKVKMSKKATSIDMTAMCDVAFLLLTFFILTATAKQPEPLPVDTPSSTNQTKLPDSDLATITVGQKGKVFFGIAGKDLREETLKSMSKQYKVAFSQEDVEKFALIETFGVPIEDLKRVLDLKSSERNEAGSQPGIPKDSLNNQLADWIQFSRRAAIDLHNKELSIAIKGDAKEEYPQIK
ncbi:MAG: biopolymer transporter ExbD, partial [Proteobacteria bacterium]